MLSREEVEVLSKAMEDVQEKAVATQENLENNMRIFECQQADFENEKANLHTQMQAVIEEKNSLKKMRKETNDMLEKIYSVSDICKHIIEKEHMLNKDFLDFLDSIGQQKNIPLRQNVEKLFKKFDKERKDRMMKLYGQTSISDYRNKSRVCTMDDIIAQRIRQQDKERASEFDFF